MSDDRPAVFLSYASQDAEAARRICEALRLAGVHVWFDQSELAGGDAWDAKIRDQVAACALFMPIVSANTQARSEGYFRIEWRLAAQRTHAMADDKAFLVPIVIDDTRDGDARVPAEFKAVQWTRLPHGETGPAFCERVQALLSGGAMMGHPRGTGGDAGGARPAAAPAKRKGPSWRGALMVGVPLVAGLLLVWRGLAWRASRHPAAEADLRPAAAEAPGGLFPRDPELKRAWDLFLNSPNASAEDFAFAEEIVKAAVTRRPADAEVVIVYAWLNDSFINRGFDLSEERYVFAQRYAGRAVQLQPDNPEALAALGQFLSFREADMGRAEQLLRRAIALDPNQARFYRALAYNVLRPSRPAEAILLEERAAGRFPKDPLVFYELGVLYRNAGRLDDMEHAFDHCLALAPIGGAMMWKAWSAVWIHGDVAGMRHWLEHLPAEVRLSDRAVIVEYEVACLTRNPADLADAVRAVQAFPGSGLHDFWYAGPKALLLGDLYAALGKPEVAKGQYEQALADVRRQKASTPADSDLLAAESWALVGLGRRAEALAALHVRVNLVLGDRWSGTLAWWFSSIPAYLLLGDRQDAVQLMKRIATTAAARNQVRTALRVDPRVAAWRSDPEINAVAAEPAPR